MIIESFALQANEIIGMAGSVMKRMKGVRLPPSPIYYPLHSQLMVASRGLMLYSVLLIQMEQKGPLYCKKAGNCEP